MSELKKGICIISTTLILFIILIVLLKCVDVKALYDCDSIGLAGLNKTYYKEYNKVIEIISDVLFYIVIAFNVFLIVLYAIDLAKTKSIKSGYKFYVYFGILALGIVLWLLFDKVICINTRPYAKDGIVEGSFPSTHIFLTTYIMLASPYLFLKMEGNKGLEKANKLGFEEIITIIMLVVVLAMTILRLYSGMHWLTDCFGGLLLGSFLFGVFYLLICIIKNKKSQE